VGQCLPDLAADPHRAEEDRLEGTGPLLVGDGDDRALGRATHADERAVEASPAVQRRPDQPFGGRRVGVVGNDRLGRVSQRLLRGREPLLVAPGQDDAGALLDQGVGGGAAEAAGTPGDDEDTVRELEVHAREPSEDATADWLMVVERAARQGTRSRPACRDL